MKKTIQQQPRAKPAWSKLRRGTVIVLASSSMVVVFGFAAFSVDVGYITLTKAQLEAAADGSALAAGSELIAGLGKGAWKTGAEVEADGAQAAATVAAANRAGDQQSVYLDPNRDVRFGQYTYDPNTGQYQKLWGVEPYNMVEVTLRRDQEIGAADGPLPLFFAPVIGHRTASLSVKSTVALFAGHGIEIKVGSGKLGEFLPFTLDQETWEMVKAGTAPPPGDPRTFQDKFGWDEETKTFYHGADGKFEVSVYPEGNPGLNTSGSYYPPGMRGTVDLGSADNSTSHIERQIVYGCNEQDLVPFGGVLSATETEPLWINGDTGVSAGFKEELETIKGGTVRLIPIHRTVTGSGDNARYEIIEFTPVRVMEVKMVGNPKRIIVQPTTLSSGNVIISPVTDITESSIFTNPRLVPND